MHYSTVQIIVMYTEPDDDRMLSYCRWLWGRSDVCEHTYEHESEKSLNVLECIIDTIAGDILDAACLYGY